MLGGGFDHTQKIGVYGGKVPRHTRLTPFSSAEHKSTAEAKSCRVTLHRVVISICRREISRDLASKRGKSGQEVHTWSRTEGGGAEGRAAEWNPQACAQPCRAAIQAKW